MAAILAAYFADRNGERSPLLLFHIGCIVAGFFVCLAGSQRWVPGLVYFGVFLAILGKPPYAFTHIVGHPNKQKEYTPLFPPS